VWGECGMSRAKTAEPIELPFGTVTGVCLESCTLGYGRSHWCHMANTVERLRPAAISAWVCRQGGDAACSQITLGNFVTSN